MDTLQWIHDFLTGRKIESLHEAEDAQFGDGKFILCKEFGLSPDEATAVMTTLQETHIRRMGYKTGREIQQWIKEKLAPEHLEGVLSWGKVAASKHIRNIYSMSMVDAMDVVRMIQDGVNPVTQKATVRIRVEGRERLVELRALLDHAGFSYHVDI